MLWSAAVVAKRAYLTSAQNFRACSAAYNRGLGEGWLLMGGGDLQMWPEADIIGLEAIPAAEEWLGGRCGCRQQTQREPGGQRHRYWCPCRGKDENNFRLGVIWVVRYKTGDGIQASPGHPVFFFHFLLPPNPYVLLSFPVCNSHTPLIHARALNCTQHRRISETALFFLCPDPRAAAWTLELCSST